jgi:hypothetical protein
MNPTILLALAKGIDTDSARDLVAPGTYEIDETVRVTGTVRVGDDYQQRLVAKADPWKLLACALSKLNNVSIEALVREAETFDTEATKLAAKTAIEALKEATYTTVRGKVTSLIAVEPVRARRAL